MKNSKLRQNGEAGKKKHWKALEKARLENFEIKEVKYVGKED